MKNESKCMIKSNIFLFVYLVYAVMICLNDYLIYCFKWNYSFSFIISGVLVVLIMIIYLMKNKVEWQRISFNIYDVIIVLIIMLLCTIRAIMPDTSYDTRNYHLYYQKFFDRDFINYDFFPMRAFNAQTFGAIGDRLYYGFRYFLGFRMGTLLNTLVVILIYFQLKQIFYMIWEEFGHNCKSNWSKILISIGTFICLMTETIYVNLSTYMVDFLAIPFLLEIFRVILCNEENSEDMNVAHTAGYLCIMCGFSMGIKLTNLLVIFPLALFFLVKHKNVINIKMVFYSCLALLYPLCLYLFISYKITGNPLFPYLNGIFESPYFSIDRSPNDFSGFNGRFGPVKSWEYLLWPVYMLKFPERASEFAMCSGRLLIVAVIFIIVVFSDLRHFRHKARSVFFYMIYCYALFILVLHGYMRYIPIMEMLGSILSFIILTDWICNRSYIMKIMGVVSVHFLLIQICTATDSYINKNCEWAWRDIKDIRAISANFPYVFHDFDSGIDGEILDDIECFVVAEASGSLSSELKGGGYVPIIGINPYFAATNEYTEELLKQRLKEIGGMNIYSLTKRDGWLDNFALYNNWGLALEEIITIQPDFYHKLYCLPLIKLKSVEDGIILNCKSFSSSDEIFTVSVAEDVDYMDIFIGDMIEEVKTTDNEYHISIVGRNLETGEEQVILEDAVITQTGRYIKESVNQSDYDIDQIEIRKVLYGDSAEEANETVQIVLQEYMK